MPHYYGGNLEVAICFTMIKLYQYICSHQAYFSVPTGFNSRNDTYSLKSPMKLA